MTEGGLLLVLADERGEVVYAADEHNGAYEQKMEAHAVDDGGTHGVSHNPYHEMEQDLSWQVGESHYLATPTDFDEFTDRMAASEDGRLAYLLDDGVTLVVGRGVRPSDAGPFASSTLLYASAQLEAPQTLMGILRAQLLATIVVTLCLAVAVAWLLSRRLARPVVGLSRQAARLSESDFALERQECGCAELDTLSASLFAAADELGRADASRREFLANVAHDLRTPLTMIRGYAEMVRDISGDDPAQRSQDIEVIVQETERLEELVNDILEYSALADGSCVSVRESLDMWQLASEVARRFEPLARQRGVELGMGDQTDTPVSGDRLQLSRVLYNLLGNALSHVGEGDSILVGVMPVGIGDVIRVEVSDSGEGVAQEDLAHVWDRYFTRRQIARGAAGSGLGPAISRQILEAHGATWGASSEPGHGTVFWFEMARRLP